MSQIKDAGIYNQKIAEFSAIKYDDGVPLNDKISLCEEIVFSDYSRENEKTDCVFELVELYKQGRRNQKIVDLVMTEMKLHFKSDGKNDSESKWWDFVSNAYPQLMFCVVDAYIELNNYV